MPDSTSTAIQTNAEGPKEVLVDGVKNVQHPLKDQIEADKYLDAKSARTDFRTAFTRVRIVPPGAF